MDPQRSSISSTMTSELPMPEPTVTRKPFSHFKVISYDIYGTLVDWESGIVTQLQPLVNRIPPDSDHRAYRDSIAGPARLELAAKFNELEHAVQVERPSERYDRVLEEVYLRLARRLDIAVGPEVTDEAHRFGQSIGQWPAFADTVDACQRLSRYYKLIPLSNVDRHSFGNTCAGPLKGIDFFRVYTAQDIGSYKPDLRNFEYLIQHAKEDAGVDKDEILHVAQSIMHDHVPAKKMALSSVWINRQGAGMGGFHELAALHDKGDVGYGWRYRTLGELADAVEMQRSAEE